MCSRGLSFKLSWCNIDAWGGVSMGTHCLASIDRNPKSISIL